MPLRRRHTAIRIGLGSPHDEARVARRNAASDAVRTALWREATLVTAENPQSLPAYRFVAALNEQTNIAEARVMALRNHVPAAVLLALAGIAMGSLGFAGLSAVLRGG